MKQIGSEYGIPRCVWAWISWKCNRQTTLPLLVQQEWHHTSEIPRKASNDGTSPENKQGVHASHSLQKSHCKKLSEKTREGAKLNVSNGDIYYVDPTLCGLQVLWTIFLPAFQTSSVADNKIKRWTHFTLNWLLPRASFCAIFGILGVSWFCLEIFRLLPKLLSEQFTILSKENASTLFIQTNIQSQLDFKTWFRRVTVINRKRLYEKTSVWKRRIRW